MSFATGRIFVRGSALLLTLGAFGCREQGPAERAGRAVDEAMEDAGEKMEEAGDEMEEAMEPAREKMEQ
jgi:hypothetical protein